MRLRKNINIGTQLKLKLLAQEKHHSHSANPRPIKFSHLSFVFRFLFDRTVTQLQVNINSEIGETEKILVDTVERVQGMTCDICIFFIPNTSLSMSLNQAFFNVATSRASRHTIIVADGSILNSPSCKEGTRQYLENLTTTESSKTLELSY